MTKIVNTQILVKRGNAISSGTYIGPVGELTMNTTANTLSLHNGITAGGLVIAAGVESNIYGNANVATYLSSDPTIIGIHANLTAGNAFVTTSVNTANIGMIGYVNSVAGGASLYSNANVASYLPTYSGNVGATHLVIPTVSTAGIQVGNVAISTYGWKDLLHSINVDSGASVNKPNFDTYRGGIKQYRFEVADQAWCEFHLPHDYVLGTDLYIHAHWSHDSTTVTTGSVTFGFEMIHAKGHNQQAFGNPVTATIQQNASTVQYQHMIAETVITGAGLLTLNDIEPDSLILVRVFVSANNMSTFVDPFIHFVDMHYQSNGMGTVNKTPNFYTR